MKKLLLALFSTTLFSAEILIDQAWLTSHGPSPYYLDQPDTTYKLMTEVSTPGSAFAIIAKNVKFELNSQKIIFNNSPRITFNGSFESATGWTMSENSSRHLGDALKNELYDGLYSVKFTVPAADQYIQYTKQITLEPNTTYALSAMFQRGNKNATGFEMYASLEGTTRREVKWASGNNRGIQYVQEEFTTGESPETYTVRAGIRNASLATAAVYIDHIQVTKTKVHGILVGTSGSAASRYVDIKRYGNADGSIVRQGSIRQGADGASWSTAVRNQATDVELSGLKTYVKGANSNSILWRSGIGRIVKCGMQSDPKLIISNRDQQYGSVLDVQYGKVEIFGNTILDGPQMGINTPGTATTKIHGNKIRLKGRYTNGFAILASGPGAEVFNNIIDCTGAYACRGIKVESGTPELPIKVYNNTVKFQYWANNQEYMGYPLGGGYGIQLESVDNAEVYGNDVTAFGNEVAAFALRLNHPLSNVVIRDNTFRAVSGANHASALKMGGVTTSGPFVFTNNKLIVNEGLIGETNKTKLEIRNLFVKFENTIADPYYIFEAEYTGSDEPLHTEITFLDPSFFDDVSRQLLASAKWRKVHDRPQRGEDNRMAFYLKWTTKILAAPNQIIEIKDAQGSVVYTGLTDESGKAEVPLQEYMIIGGTKTLTQLYEIRVNGVSKQVTADKAQTVVF